MSGGCNGICMWASDIGVDVYPDAIAYPHPACPDHGDDRWCRDCEGWGSIAGRLSEDKQMTCPMCGGSGIRDDTEAATRG